VTNCFGKRGHDGSSEEGTEENLGGEQKGERVHGAWGAKSTKCFREREEQPGFHRCIREGGGLSANKPEPEREIAQAVPLKAWSNRWRCA